MSIFVYSPLFAENSTVFALFSTRKVIFSRIDELFIKNAIGMPTRQACTWFYTRVTAKITFSYPRALLSLIERYQMVLSVAKLIKTII